MATTAALQTAHSAQPVHGHLVRDGFTFAIAAGLPVGLFGLANLGAEALGVMPLFFAPFGIPGWIGAAAHLAQLSLLGIAFWAVARATIVRSPLIWMGAIIAAYILLPFITAPLDSLQLSLVCSLLFLVTLAGTHRAGTVSKLAGWLMVPTLGILGFSAVMGLAVAAAYSPPFAVVHGQQPVPAVA